MVNYKIFILLIFTLSSCNCDDEELSLQRMDYNGTELKINGYYYYETSNFQEQLVDVYFLYQNGIILYGGSIPKTHNLEAYVLSLSEPINNDVFQSSKDGWGVFKINNNEIEFERWYPSGPPLETFIRAGTILNDTTFRITQSYKPDGSEEDERSEYYRFKKFDTKPDSTCIFIN